MTNQEQTNKETVKQLIAAWMDRDRQTYADLVAENAVQHQPWGEVNKGKSAFIETHYELTYEGFPDSQFEIDDLVAEGDLVAVRGHWRGKASGRMVGVDVTGGGFELPFMEFYRFVDGKVVEEWAQIDRLSRVKEVGAVTDLQRQNQYLSVLNRVLRHNLRNDLSVVQGNLEVARERASESVASLLVQAHETIEQLLATADTARTAQTLLEDTDVIQHDLAAVVESLVTRAHTQYPRATIETTIRETPTVEATTE